MSARLVSSTSFLVSIIFQPSSRNALSMSTSIPSLVVIFRCGINCDPTSTQYVTPPIVPSICLAFMPIHTSAIGVSGHGMVCISCALTSLISPSESMSMAFIVLSAFSLPITHPAFR